MKHVRQVRQLLASTPQFNANLTLTLTLSLTLTLILTLTPPQHICTKIPAVRGERATSARCGTDRGEVHAKTCATARATRTCILTESHNRSWHENHLPSDQCLYKLRQRGSLCCPQAVRASHVTSIGRPPHQFAFAAARSDPGVFQFLARRVSRPLIDPPVVRSPRRCVIRRGGHSCD